MGETHIRVSDKTHERLREIRAKTGRTQKAAANQAVERYHEKLLGGENNENTSEQTPVTEPESANKDHGTPENNGETVEYSF